MPLMHGVERSPEDADAVPVTELSGLDRRGTRDWKS
jgi:hypothetical protein